MSEYIPPRNAVTQLFLQVPERLHGLLRELSRSHDKQSYDGPDSVSWPQVPYHYGQGRLLGYDRWLGSLSDQDQKKEVAATRVRYENYYDQMARVLVTAMAEKGHDISAYLRPASRSNTQGGPSNTGPV